MYLSALSALVVCQTPTRAVGLHTVGVIVCRAARGNVIRVHGVPGGGPAFSACAVIGHGTVTRACVIVWLPCLRQTVRGRLRSLIDFSAFPRSLLPSVCVIPGLTPLLSTVNIASADWSVHACQSAVDWPFRMSAWPRGGWSSRLPCPRVGPVLSRLGLPRACRTGALAGRPARVPRLVVIRRPVVLHRCGTSALSDLRNQLSRRFHGPRRVQAVVCDFANWPCPHTICHVRACSSAAVLTWTIAWRRSLRGGHSGVQ